jgi:ribonuclease P/MRP protein subunit RPP40
LANVVPIHKKGAKKLRDNYRPISLTSVISKILESFVREAIIQHMNKHNMFSEHQFGFITGRSTILQLLVILDKWTDIIDKGGAVESIYLDFRKAFDTVPHIRLLLKLQYYGIGQPLLGWIQDFITNREQRVVINNTCSKWEQISSGIPQGSVLGTLLFVIYINDMPNNLHKSCLLFADDAKIFSKITVNDTSDAEILQQDLNRIQQWSSDWLMSFNHDKCVNLVVGSKRIITQIDIDFYMTDSNDEGRDIIRTLKKPLNEKDLGVYIDNNLDFKKHIDIITKKAHSTMGIIKRNFLYLDKNNFVPLYTTIVRPQLEYAQCIWSPYKRGDVRRIEAVQRYATRQVRGIRQLTYEERLRFLDLPTLVFRRMRGDMIETYKILHCIYDNTVSPILPLAENHLRGNKLKLYKRRANSDLRRNFFTIRVVDFWNALPSYIVSSASLNIFKNNLDKEWKNHPAKYNFEAIWNRDVF